jgi:hypothetical protein
MGWAVGVFYCESCLREFLAWAGCVGGGAFQAILKRAAHARAQAAVSAECSVFLKSDRAGCEA